MMRLDLFMAECPACREKNRLKIVKTQASFSRLPPELEILGSPGRILIHFTTQARFAKR